MAEYDEWVSARADRWLQMEAEHNARWAQLAYLDGPGYTVCDRIEAKMDLRRQYFSGSSSHGVQNSIQKTPTQPCSSHRSSSSLDESNRQYNLRMDEYTRKIRESCARILELLQEEIDATESVTDALPTSDETLPSMEQIDASDSLIVEVQVSTDFLPSKEPTDSPFIIDKNLVVHHISPRQEVQLTQILESLNCPVSAAMDVAVTRPMKMEDDVVNIPLLAAPTHSFIADALLIHTYPYDPGPIGSPPLTTVSYPHVFQLSIPMCSIVTPIVSVGVIFGYDRGASFAYINIESSCEAHYLFVKMPLKTNYSCHNLKSLLCGIEIHASFVHDEISRSGAVGPIMFLLSEKLGVVAFDCLQHCGFGLEFFVTVGTLSPHDSSSVKHVCSSCDANPNFMVSCDFENQLLYYVRFEDISMQELAVIVTFKLCDTSKELKIVMSQHSHTMSSVHKSRVGYHDKLNDFIIQCMVNLSHKQKLIDDCVSQSYEIAVGTAFCCHCLKVLVGTVLLDLKGRLAHQLVTQIWKVRLRCIGGIPYNAPKLAKDQKLNMSSKPWVFTSGTVEKTLIIGYTCSLFSHGMHHLIICSNTPKIKFLKEVEDMSTAAEMRLMQRRVAMQRGVSILEIFKNFALVHAVIGVDPSNSFYEILERVSIFISFVYGVASYCLRADSMANTSDFAPDNVVSNDIMALVMKVELKDQCELIDIFSKVDVKLTLIAYFAFVVAWYKNNQWPIHVLQLMETYEYLAQFRTYQEVFTQWLLDQSEAILKNYTLIQLLDFLVWVAAIDFCAMFCYDFSIAFNTFTMSTSHTSKYMQLEIKEKHSMKLDLGGMGYFFIIKEFLQFKQWDPGGCLSVNVKDYLFWKSLGNMLVAPKCIYLNFNLEDKVDFKGEGNVMILNRENHVIK